MAQLVESHTTPEINISNPKHWQNVILTHYKFKKKNENKEKEAGKASFRKKNVENVRTIFRAWELPLRVFNVLFKSNNGALNACLKP